MLSPVATHEHHELAEVGKVAVGAGFGGLLGWVATMASVAGTASHFRVWTLWSVLLVVASSVALVGGGVLWRVFRDRTRHTYLRVPPGANVNISVGSQSSQVTSTGLTEGTGSTASS
jgi:hypothetical protein